MDPTLPPGISRRTPVPADLNIPNIDGGSSGLRAQVRLTRPGTVTTGLAIPDGVSALRLGAGIDMGRGGLAVSVAQPSSLNAASVMPASVAATADRRVRLVPISGRSTTPRLDAGVVDLLLGDPAAFRSLLESDVSPSLIPRLRRW